MKKAELEEATKLYHARMDNARLALREGRVSDSVREAVAAWEHLDARMRYEQRYDSAEFETVDCVEIVLDHAPFVLDYDSLSRLEQLLKKSRRIERNTSKNLVDALAVASARLRCVYQIVDQLENEVLVPESAFQTQDPGAGIDMREMLKRLYKAGLIELESSDGHRACRLATAMSEHWYAKCRSCGETVKGPKRRFLSKLGCPACRSESSFVVIRRAS
jgi:Fe2+ or Zn2+ uptake regulation protein